MTSALGELYRERYPQLVRLAAAVLRDTAAAEDIAQDAFLPLAAGQAPREPGAWLRACARNAAVSALRHREVERRHAPGLACQPVPDIADQAAARCAVRSALAALPFRQRQALVLHYYAGLPESGIAAAMGVSGGTVKAHIKKGRAHLRALLGEC